jgi:hypothetical protein
MTTAAFTERFTGALDQVSDNVGIDRGIGHTSEGNRQS